MEAQTKICQNCKNSFTVEPEDFVFYEKIGVPEPTLCPQCRYQRRLANRNELNFHHRTCGLCGTKMATIYTPDYPGPVYCQPCWWSDNWDSLAYGRDFDFSRPFFEQFREHRYSVPRVALADANSVNSDYSNQAGNNKNCHMVTCSNHCEDCLYGIWNQDSKSCMDSWALKDCEFMYEALNCRKCYKCMFVEDLSDTSEMYFSSDCRGGSNCFGCVGLRNKSYCWFNEQLSKEEYLQRLANFSWTLENINNARAKLRELSLTVPHKYYHGHQNVNSTGDYISEDRNVRQAFNSPRSENLSYGQDAWEARDCMDLTETLDNELDYEMEGCGWGSGCICTAKAWYNQNVFYSEYNFIASSLFGCVSTRGKSYCIFNKQYSKEGYEKLKAQIIEHMKKTGEWGEFFPIVTSPFPYNDTVAQQYFPLDKEAVLARGWHWYDRGARSYKVTLPYNKLPNLIEYTPDSIVKEVIGCSSQDSEDGKKNYLRCTTAFNIHPAELAFYRNFNLPLPHKCFNCRFQDRMARRNPRQLWHRKCMKEGCPNEFETSYAPDRPEVIYCESCYQQEVV